MEHLYVNFVDPSCIVYLDMVRKSRQTDRQTNAAENRTPVTAVDVAE